MSERPVFDRTAVLLLAGAVLAATSVSAQEPTLGLSGESRPAAGATVPTASPAPIIGGRMSCGTARLVSAPLGAGAGMLGTAILYELISASSTSSRTPTLGADLRTPGGNRTALVLVGGGLGLMMGILAPPVARECWIQLPGHRGGASPASSHKEPAPQGRLGISQP